VAGYGEGVSEIAGREFGEVYMTWADDPPNGPKLRIAAAAGHVMITAPLLALVDAGESPWAQIREAGPPGDGDPYGYRGSVLRIEADNRTVTYRVGGYRPECRCYEARLIVDLEVVGGVADGRQQRLG
jgi:hypothetical protein